MTLYTKEDIDNLVDEGKRQICGHVKSLKELKALHSLGYEMKRLIPGSEHGERDSIWYFEAVKHVRK